MFLYIQTFNVPLSSLIMVAIGVDRYFCICHPFLHAVTVPRAKICLLVLTVLCALMGVIPALSHAVYQPSIVQANESVPNSPLSTHPAMLTDTKKTSSPLSTRSSTELYTNGLYVKPAPEFMIGQNVTVNYKTDNSILPVTRSLDNVAANYSFSIFNQTIYEYSGYCYISFMSVSENVIDLYQKAYATLFLLEFAILALLYALIYRSIHVRRAWKAKRKRMSCYASTHCPETVAEETQLTNINGTATETVIVKKNHGHFSSAMRDRTLYANIKTAAMLFVVTVGFVVSFLPSWLMGLRLIRFNIIVFYMFYINNVINPIIYAFMNRTFRDDMFQLMRSCFRL